MNPVAGAGTTIGAYIVAYRAARMKGNLKNAQEVINALSAEIQAHLDARVVNFERYCASVQALADITGVDEQSITGIIEKYRGSDTVRWKRERAMVNMLQHHDISGVNKDIKDVGEGAGADSEALARLGNQIREMLDRLDITPARQPLAYEVEAGRAAREAREKAAADEAAAKFRAEMERREKIEKYHKDRAERWAAKGPGVFGWRTWFAGRGCGRDVETGQESASKPATPGPRPGPE